MTLISKTIKLRICYFIVMLMMIIIFDVKVNAQELQATEDESIRVVTTVEEFHAAMADSSVNVIEVNGTLSPLKGSGNDPLIINRPLTIRGGTLDLWYLGIVLGADVTFQNIEINMASPESNGIVLNGHTLTLKGVTRGNNVSWDTHIYCGGMDGYSYANLPAPGSDANVVIQGNTHVGNIYAGNMVHGNIATSTYHGNATIVIDSSMTGTIGGIYGSGGREVMGEGDGNAVNTGMEYGVTGDINITLYDSKVKSVVGYAENVSVEFHGSGNQAEPRLENITSLEVTSGLLQPSVNSSFITALPEITVGEQGTLNLSSYGDTYIGNFNGGGTLVLGKEQKITLEGNISGNTEVYIESHMYPEIPADEHTYIEAMFVEEENFVFHGSDANPSYVPFFVSNNAGGGIWTTIEELKTEEPTEQVIRVTDFNIEDCIVKEVDESFAWMEMPMTVSYTPESNISIDEVALKVSVNDQEAIVVQEGDYYCYQTEQVYCYPYTMAGKWIVYDASYTTVPQDGIYCFQVTIPAEFTESGSPIVTEATLTVGEVEGNGDDNNGESGDGEGDGTQEEVPEGIRVEGIVENGYEYTGSPIKPNIIVYDGKHKLRNRVDYSIDYKNNINANISIDGTKLYENEDNIKVPTIVIQGKGNYKGSISVTFDIYSKDIATTTVSDMFAIENNKVQLAKPIVKDGKKTLRKDYHYTVEYPDLDEGIPDAYKVTGNYRIILHGKGNYGGAKEVTLFIDKKKLIRQAVVTRIPVQRYTGEAIEPTLFIRYEGEKLVCGEDYTVTYVNNIAPGTATAIIRGMNDYFGEKQVNFRIREAKITTEKIQEAGKEKMVQEPQNTEIEPMFQTPTEDNVRNNQTEEEKQVAEKSSISYDIKKVKMVVSTQTYSPEGVTLKKEDIRVLGGQPDVEYEIVGYDRNNRRGTAIVVIKGVGKYDGIRIVKFKIKAKELEIARALK